MAGKKAKKSPTIAFVTVCKGRLHHLKQTLPLMAAQAPDELIVVDYDCPDKAGEWVEAEFPQARVVRASQPDGGFNIARGRNLGAAAASSEWLFFVDADICLAPDILEKVRPALEARHFYQPMPKGVGGGGNYGSFVCSAADFAAIGGYDEVFEGWGREDKDMYLRLQGHRVKKAFYSPELVRVIEHDDGERHILPEMQDRWQNEAVNACYLAAKQKISHLRRAGGNLPLEERRKLMDTIRELVSRWYAAGARERLPVRLVVGRDPTLMLASGMHIRTEVAVTVVLEPPPRA